MNHRINQGCALAHISHHPSATSADLRAYAGRAPKIVLDRLQACLRAIFVRAPSIHGRLDAFAANAGVTHEKPSALSPANHVAFRKRPGAKSTSFARSGIASQPLRAVVFDLDGTLVDTLVDISTAVNFALNQLGAPVHKPDTIRGFVGQGVEQLMSAALPPDRQIELNAAVSLFRSHYDKHGLGHTKPYPGIMEALTRLVDAAIPLAILSNKYEPAARQIVSALFPSHWFIDVRGQRPNVPLKPDPTSALELCHHLGVAPSNCAMVGDLAADIEVAKSANMTAIGVAWGFGNASQLRDLGAHEIVYSPAELGEVLLRRAA